MKPPQHSEELDFTVSFGDHRRTIDRRQFSYSTHIPERRKRVDRRRLPQVGGSVLNGGEAIRQKVLFVQ